MQELTVPQLLYGGLTVLTGVVGVFWRMLSSSNKATADKLSHCEGKHEEATKELQKIREDVGYLRGRQEATENLARQVLQVVAEVSKKHPNEGN